MAKVESKADGYRDLEAKLWAAADKLRGTLDAAEYKHVVLGLIFLKYISDSFEDRRSELERLSRDKNSDYFVKDEAQREQVLEDKDAYSEETSSGCHPRRAGRSCRTTRSSRTSPR